MPDPFIVFAPDVVEEEGHYPSPFDKERLGFFRDLGRAAGTKALGVGLDRLPPGERTSFTHAHSHEEEFVYVIEGECHVRLIEPGEPPREVPLRAGHFVSFPAGTRIAHCFVNRGTRDCITLTVGDRKHEDRCFYAEDAEYNEFFARERASQYWTPG
jgi:uncharacterized cupin superfamily protein